jgi:serine/threonine protein phosphatase PrpC
VCPASQIVLAVFDGHGAEGDSCSKFARAQLPSTLAAEMKLTPNLPAAALKKSLSKINERTRRSLQPRIERSQPTVPLATATPILLPDFASHE